LPEDFPVFVTDLHAFGRFIGHDWLET
jgi:hypothetical protein